jgi:dTDP-4-dehydrorhamnose reductase
MRTVILGAGGQLGRELVRLLDHDGGVVPLAHADLDVRDADRVIACLRALAPEVVVNAVADNRVDRAEDDPCEAMAVNALAVATLAHACRELDALLVQPSTDYVFDGMSTRPYTETDPVNPLGAYARSKLAGELFARTLAPRHAVIRVAGLYAEGGSSGKGGSFIDRILAQARKGERLRVVADQVVAPTYARDVAATLVRLLPRLARGEAPVGVYHVSNAEACTWFEFAQTALELAGVPAAIEPITTAALAARAPRPPYSVLANTRLATLREPPLRSWRLALEAYVCGE